jgi:hypothetical protein
MKAEITIYKSTDVGGYYAGIKIFHPFIELEQEILSTTQVSKGQVKRKAIQFCGDLGLDYKFT